MPRVECNGAEIYYEKYGSGTPVVFLHGVTMSSRFFLQQRSSLPENFQAILLDFRGHGRSEKTDTGHTLPEYARDLRAFFDELNLTDVVPVGWSMGALVLWEYVKQFGTANLQGTVVVDQHAADLQREDYEHGFVDAEGLRELVATSQTDPEAIVDQFMDGMFHQALDQDTAMRLSDEISRVPPPIQTAILYDQSVRDYRDVLNEVTVPTLVCVGSDDKLISAAGVDYVADSMPNTERVRFKASSHCPFIEQPQRFNEAVSKFLTRL